MLDVLQNSPVEVIKRQGGEIKMSEELLIAQEEYLKSGIHIGTKFKTKYMANFIYKTRPDGLSVLNLQKIDERIKIAANMLSKYKPEEILIASRRENSWKAVKAFAKVTGIRYFAGRYPPGVMTNPELKNFIEAKIVLVTDSWPDRNAINDANKIGIPVIACCDTNNQANYIDLVVPCNNKGKKSLGLFFWLLAREYMRKTGKIGGNEELDAPLDDFTED